MRGKCDLCGETKEQCYHFVYDGVLGFTLDYCLDCGESIKELIDDLEKTLKAKDD